MSQRGCWSLSYIPTAVCLILSRRLLLHIMQRILLPTHYVRVYIYGTVAAFIAQQWYRGASGGNIYLFCEARPRLWANRLSLEYWDF